MVNGQMLQSSIADVQQLEGSSVDNIDPRFSVIKDSVGEARFS